MDGKKVTYIDKSIKHKHEYTEKYILEITNKNIHASANYYNKCDYYEVLKCKECMAFTSIKKEGNYSGYILGDVNEFLNSNNLPFIYADSLQKGPEYHFDELINVRLDK